MVDAIHEIIELKSVLRAAIIVELIAGICPLDVIESIRKGASRYKKVKSSFEKESRVEARRKMSMSKVVSVRLFREN